MRGVRYSLLTRIAIILTVIFVLSGALWIRSFLVSEAIMWAPNERAHRFELLITRGQMRFSYCSRNEDGGGFDHWYYDQPIDIGGMPRVARISLVFWRFGRRETLFSVEARCWFISACFGFGSLLASAMSLLQHRRRTAAREKICQRCGYDLRASPTRCPECGLTISRDTQRPWAPAN
jgi:hypothetical protein